MARTPEGQAGGKGLQPDPAVPDDGASAAGELAVEVDGVVVACDPGAGGELLALQAVLHEGRQHVPHHLGCDGVVRGPTVQGREAGPDLHPLKRQDHLGIACADADVRDSVLVVAEPQDHVLEEGEERRRWAVVGPPLHTLGARRRRSGLLDLLGIGRHRFGRPAVLAVEGHESVEDVLVGAPGPSQPVGKAQAVLRQRREVLASPKPDRAELLV